MKENTIYCSFSFQIVILCHASALIGNNPQSAHVESNSTYISPHHGPEARSVISRRRAAGQDRAEVAVAVTNQQQPHCSKYCDDCQPPAATTATA